MDQPTILGQPAPPDPPEEEGRNPENLELDCALGILPATALNLTALLGAAPFITLPLFLTTMLGPQVLLGWAAGLLLALCEGLVWAELAAAYPRSGGPYNMLREAFGRNSWGRILCFLFLWQVVIMGPLLVAAGALHFSGTLAGLLPGLEDAASRKLGAMALVALLTALLHLRIRVLGQLAVSFAAGGILALGWLILAGDPGAGWERLMAWPVPLHSLNWGLLAGLAAGMLAARLDYQGFFISTFLGGEVQRPTRVLPQSILAAILLFGVLQLLALAGTAGTAFWEATGSSFASADSLSGGPVGDGAHPALILASLWCLGGGVFAWLLALSRVPLAAARDGHLFALFGRLDPQRRIPHISLRAMGIASALGCLLDLRSLLSALILVPVLVPSLALGVAVFLARRRLPPAERPFRMWLFPIPVLLTVGAWLFVAARAGWRAALLAASVLAVGGLLYLLVSLRGRIWPFDPED